MVGAKEAAVPFFAYYPTLLPHGPVRPTPHSVTDPGDTSNPESRLFIDMIQYLDTIVGKLVDALVANELRDNTVVMFTSDNGPVGYGPGGGGKGRTTHAGTHVPLIVNCPGIVSDGFVSGNLVDFSDFLPTIADIGQAAQPSNMVLDGRSFWPECRGELKCPDRGSSSSTTLRRLGFKGWTAWCRGGRLLALP